MNLLTVIPLSGFHCTPKIRSGQVRSIFEGTFRNENLKTTTIKQFFLKNRLFNFEGNSFDRSTAQLHMCSTNSMSFVMSLFLYVCLFVSLCLYVYFFVCLFICLSVYLFVCLFVCLFICLSVHLFVCMFVRFCIFVCMFIFFQRTFDIHPYEKKLFKLCFHSWLCNCACHLSVL